MPLRRPPSPPVVFLIVLFSVVLAGLAQSRHNNRVAALPSPTPHGFPQPARVPPMPFAPQGANLPFGPGMPFDPLHLTVAASRGVSPRTSSLLPVFAPANSDASSVFYEEHTYDSGGQYPFSITLADVNGDSIPDVLIANRCTIIDCSNGSVSVLLGNGDGTFRAAQTYTSGGQTASSVTVSDVNGDGKPDLLVANQCITNCSSGGVSVLLGNGDGTFQPAQAYASGGLYADSIAVGDLNGDGKLDLMVANVCVNPCTGNAVVGVLLGNGDGTFQAAQTYSAGEPTTSSIAVADVNGDGKLDLLLANQCFGSGNCSTGGGVSVLLGNGDGTFQAAQTYSSGGEYTNSIAVGDVNGDGKPDLLVANQCFPNQNCASGSVGVLLGNGDGTFQPAQAYSSGGSTAFSIVLGDVNGDGKPDVLVANRDINSDDPFTGGVGVLLGNGDGTFQAARTYGSGGLGAYSIAAVDINGDGKPDVVVANLCTNYNNCSGGSVGVLLGNGDGTFQSTPNYDSGGQAPYSIAVADVNGDGKPDLLVANECIGYGNCSIEGSVGVLLGNGDGTFQPSQTYGSGAYVAFSIAVADVNGDGKPDLVVANYCVSSTNCSNGVISVLLGNGDGTFQAAQTFSSGGQYALSLAVADVNGDGKPDLVVANQCNTNCTSGIVGVLLGNGDGTFQTAQTYSSGAQYGRSVAVGDVNGDGKVDVLVTNECGSDCSTGGVGVLLGNGDGTFQPAQINSSGGYSAESIAIGDVNGDGKPDLVVSNYCGSNVNCATGGVSILLGNADGTFQAAQVTLTPANFSQGQIALSDFNGDGNLDIAIGNGSVLLLGNGDGTFQTPLSLGAGGAGTAIGDFNGDGKPDLAVGGVDVLLNIASGFRYPTATVVTSSSNPANAGQPVTFTAAVSGFNISGATGNVTFYDGGTALSAVAIINGQAQFSTSSLTLGTHSITASYAGDTNYLSSTSPVVTETIRTTATATALSSSLQTSAFGQSVTFTANVSSASGTPTGTVSFSDGTTLFGTVALAGGSAALSTSALLPGAHTITANYSGDSNFSPSSASIAQTVNQAATATSVSSNLNPAVWGQSITLSATVTPQYGGTVTGTINFYDGPSLVGTGTVSGNAASANVVLAVGIHSITAVYSGDSNFLGSTSSPLSQSVNQATTAIQLFSSANPSYPNQTVYFTPTIVSQYGGTISGTVTYKQGNTVLAVLNYPTPYSTTYTTTGTRSITAVYSGDNDNLGSTSAVLKQVVNNLPATTTTTVVTSGSPTFINQPVTFASTTTSTYGTITDGESITFYDGATVIGTGFTMHGVASFTTSTLKAGTHTIKASYPGGGTFKASSGTVKQVVNLYPSSVSTPSSSLNPSVFGQSVTLRSTVTSTAPAAPTGTVTFKNGTTSLGTVTLNASGVASLTKTNLSVGALTITAAYNGDSETAKSASSAIAQIVNQAAISMGLTSTPNPSTNGQSVKFTATLTSNGGLPNGQTVTFSYNGNTLGTATITGGKATFSTTALPSGSDQVTATYAGNVDYSAASAMVIQTVN